MSFSLAKFVPEFLSARPSEKFTAREIASWIMATYPEECSEKMRRSRAVAVPLDTPDALLQQIVAEIGSQREALSKRNIKSTEGRPRRFYFSLLTDEAEVTATEKIASPQSIGGAGAGSISEYQLYPMLGHFLREEMGIFSKRIDEKRARNTRGRGGNRWVFPDLVAIEDLGSRWHREVQDCIRESSQRRAKLWSFEVKLLVNSSNVRETYFQAVSNSSWANAGYLVAAEISGSGTMRELRVLSGLHGIGVIKLDTINLAESEILIPSVERADVDWETANRIAEENEDFVSYVKLVRQFYQTGELRPQDWD